MGSEIVAAARRAGCDILALTHADCEVTDRSSVETSLRPLGPGDAVVNTAAFHRTDDCEDNPDTAMAVNGVGAQNVAIVARQRGAMVAFLSSDYVFNGNKRVPYVESDVPSPINAYGVSKLAGEMLVAEANAQHYVTRISSVFGIAGSSGKGGNFVESMLAKARRGESIQVVDDLVMAPTFASDAAELLVRLLRMQAPFGTYHLANMGSCSWYEFASAIFDVAGVNAHLTATSTSAYAGKAARPPYSVLASEKLAGLDLRARPWREALADYLAQRQRP